MSITRDKILDLFRNRPDQFVSGADVCRELGISRTAVWKHIQQLRESDYKIEAIPSRGYRLICLPDRLLPAEVKAGLKTRCVGREIVYFEQTDSTNEQARKLADSGAVEGTVVIADTQTGAKADSVATGHPRPESIFICQSSCARISLPVLQPR